MFRTFLVIPSLLAGLGLILVGNGLLGTLLAVRATAEGVSPTGIGAFMALYFAGFACGTLWVPPLVRRIRYIRTFSLMGAVICCAALLHGLWPNMVFWGMLRFASGFCMVGIYTVIESWLNVLATDETRSTYYSAYMFVCLFALGIGQFFVALDDGIGLTAFLMIGFFVSAGLIPVGLTRVAEPVLGPMRSSGFQEIFRKAPLGVAGCTVSGIAGGAFWGVGPSFVKSVAPVEAVAWFMGAAVFGGLFFQWPTGWLAARFDRRQVLALLSGSAACMAAVFMFLPVNAGPVLAMASLVFGALLFSLYPVSVSITNDRISPDEALEAARGLLLMNGIGAAAGPLAGGIIMDLLGNRGLFVFFAVIFLPLAVYSAYRLRIPLPRPAEEQTPFAPLTRTAAVVLDMHPGVETTEEQAAIHTPDDRGPT